jgi:UDP-3-O-[3-hydroxymyristoyl] glucosamine N-acyltransferase
MSPPKPLVIVGAGGHGRSVLELVRLLSAHTLARFLDDTQAAGTIVMSLPVWGPTALLAGLPARGAGMALAVVGTDAMLGDGASVNSGAVVDLHAWVRHHGHLGANATMAGGNSFGARAWLQTGRAIGYHVHLGDDAVISPGEGRS